MIILPDNSTLMAHEIQASGKHELVQFAAVCVRNRNVEPARVFEDWVYPIGLSLSMACMVATFLLYSVLPQLRDLTGKFILGVCAFLVAGKSSSKYTRYFYKLPLGKIFFSSSQFTLLFASHPFHALTCHSMVTPSMRARLLWKK